MEAPSRRPVRSSDLVRRIGWPGRRRRPGGEGTRGRPPAPCGEPAEPPVAARPGHILCPGHPPLRPWPFPQWPERACPPGCVLRPGGEGTRGGPPAPCGEPAECPVVARPRHVLCPGHPPLKPWPCHTGRGRPVRVPKTREV